MSSPVMYDKVGDTVTSKAFRGPFFMLKLGAKGRLALVCPLLHF